MSTSDPHLWLEDVTGEQPMAWVREQNALTDGVLAATPGFADLERDLRAVLDSDEKIPYVQQAGDHLYNFWQDAEHERGLWRRTTWDEYRKPDPAWEIVLDLDALSAAEGERWVWHGATFLRPERTRCLVALSRGGSDADVTRELDLTTLDWVPGGFERPEAKGELRWIDRDHVFVATDVGDGSMTTSGYPRIAKRWTRGTPLAEAETVFAARPDDLVVSAFHDPTPGFERDFVRRALDFYSDELFLLGLDGARTRIDAPDSANKSVHREWLLLRLRDPWQVGGTTYAAGCLLAARLEDFLAGDRTVEVLFEPDEHSSLESWTWTRSHLVLNTLVDVKSRLVVLTPAADGWRRGELAGAPELGTVGVAAVDRDESDALWLTVTDFLTPTTLAVTETGGAAGTEPEPLKSMPAFFDATGLVTEQRFATSADGTRVPYFLVRSEDLELDGSAPTLLHGYGGFEVSMLPSYSGMVGRGWLAAGGVYAVANIRGGGEYGPRWHQAALRENRHRAYDDFAAVARDLVASGVTSPERLGAAGGSNGGLLTGNMLVHHPELFGALVSYVPLLDMRRYTQLLAGASWMAEYGDPDDAADWEFVRTISPYHLLEPDRAYPPTLIWTTTRDDRVHPGHARKMAAAMLAAGAPVRYFENTEGGHGAGATNAQTAHVWALHYAFLRSALGFPGSSVGLTGSGR
jgi:prolyl oligopeptidase